MARRVAFSVALVIVTQLPLMACGSRAPSTPTARDSPSPRPTLEALPAPTTVQCTSTPSIIAFPDDGATVRGRVVIAVRTPQSGPGGCANTVGVLVNALPVMGAGGFSGCEDEGLVTWDTTRGPNGRYRLSAYSACNFCFEACSQPSDPVIEVVVDNP